jgi:uncharacterized protein (TIGR02996 family)
MTDEDAFLQEIRENPDDDFPRLVYADWLEERGDPRAEFIRVQCELSQLPDFDEQRNELATRADALLARHGDRWKQPLNQLDIEHIRFERGMIEHAAIETGTFLNAANAIFAAAPALRSVRLIRPGRQIEALTASPHLGWLSQLELVGTLIDRDDVWRLADSPHLACLASLNLTGNLIGEEGLRILSDHGTDTLNGLRSLNLNANALRDNAMPMLTTSPLLGRLVRLSLNTNRIGATGIAALATSEHAHSLRVLKLSRNAIGGEGLRSILGSENFPALEALELADCDIGIEGVRTLAESDLLSRLTSLNVAQNSIGNTGARLLAQSPSTARLVSLDLSWNGIDDAGGYALARSPLLGRLQRLSVCHNRITMSGVEALLSSPHWTDKTQLELWGSSLSAREIRKLQSRCRTVILRYGVHEHF